MNKYLVEQFKKEVQNNLAVQKVEWLGSNERFCLAVGWAIGKGLSQEEAWDFAMSIYNPISKKDEDELQKNM